MDNKDILIEELKEQTALYADTICMLKEVLNGLIGHPDMITNPARLNVADYMSFLRIHKYIDENELKSISTKTIMSYVLKGTSEKEIETFLMNLRAMGLVELKLVNKRVVAYFRGFNEFYKVRKLRAEKENR
jgi:hypothetical protein